MKKIIVGMLGTRASAEELIRQLRTDLMIHEDDISYVYRNTEGEVKQVNVETAEEHTPGEGAATGALVGGSVGALAGLATAVGMIPVIGPIFAAGPLVSLLGVTAGTAGTTAAGALTGALAGGVIGALVNLGVSSVEAKEYESRVLAGDILVAVLSENEEEVKHAFARHGATDIRSYHPTLT